MSPSKCGKPLCCDFPLRRVVQNHSSSIRYLQSQGVTNTHKKRSKKNLSSTMASGCARPLTTVRLSHPPAPNCGTNDRCRRAPCLGLWAAGMAMMGPTYSGGLCALMLPCVASAGMAMTWPTYADGPCSTMLLCLASAGMAMIGPTCSGGQCALMLLCLLVQAWR